MKGKNKIMKDTETSLYQILAKMKKAGIYDCIGRLAEDSINLYMKRFGDINYAKSIPETEFTEQIIDCVNHLVTTNDNAKKVFNNLNDEYEQSVIIAALVGIMIG